jgi:hypothetical protein
MTILSDSGERAQDETGEKTGSNPGLLAFDAASPSLASTVTFGIVRLPAS